jgi:hypothetical protein
MNESLTCRRDPGHLEASTELLSGLRAVVGHRLGDQLYPADRLPSIDALLSKTTLAPHLGAWGRELVKPPVVFAPHEVESAPVDPGDHEGAVLTKGAVDV